MHERKALALQNLKNLRDAQKQGFVWIDKQAMVVFGSSRSEPFSPVPIWRAFSEKNTGQIEDPGILDTADHFFLTKK